ncbi:zinc-dependent alcohol dehydrogenase family protein [Microbacterium pseudoresistens]|uniref:2-desacetyl-2-hydroxyethyl bacteriochlorophyllide A dehydrogenase n=1 Tax=Microbacterium pseudoresistens TaxID=640634 RepID=A0A7Y9EUJ8_9MICO|nr:alcohol dehydrogenase catalytic domain-containing protein [Microbacterium pseudoresistens]NYD54237.1 2-desacetyl-2-hydroxyethyl bacteriochlorophyllide A dehydrogenase [Microbacterium pseudoresistens]
MKSVRYHGDGVVSLDETPVPQIGPRDVLVAPTAIGVCGTDTHIIDGEFMSNPPMALGHEIAGRIVEIGRDVVAVGVGDLITVEPHLYCGTCFNCQTGSIHMCPTRRAQGVHLDGGMQEYLAIPDTLAYRVPDGVTDWEAALTEPVACCVHGLDRLNAKSGMPLAVFGAGPIGAILVALAKLQGLGPVVVVEPRESRRELALRFGADLALDPGADDFDERMRAVTAGVGFPYLIDAAGHPAVLESAIGFASRGANILLLGVAPPHAVASVRPNEIYAKELTLLGTALNPYTHRRAANLLPRLGLERLHRGEYALDDFEAALVAQREGSFDKVFLCPQQDARPANGEETR